jgi:signal transduction histidine kinase
MGSFWTNSTTALLGDNRQAVKEILTRNRCNVSGFESVALVPLRVGGETFGLLQFNDKQTGRFSEQHIALFERLATNVAMALAHRNAAAQAKEKQAEITNTSTALRHGLSEVFTALTDMASGNPAVRISETSELKLIAKLKHMVNITAKNLKEIVDLSHEFAMGLSEHFDVLNRVSQGDLAARVVGSSPIELLESFKGVTNKMIASISAEINDRIKAEREKRALEAKMYHAQKMEALSVLAASISHDINNLLMIIRAEASLMLSTIGGEHSHAEKLKSIEKQVKKGARLVAQLQGFAKAREPEIRPTNLADLVDKTADLFASSSTDMAIHKNLNAEIWKTAVDDAQIEQVLLNLYINAADAMPKGGNLYLQTENVAFGKDNPPLPNLEPGQYVRVSVTDTGVGMDENTRQRVFEPFFTTKEKGLGTGLGLASAFGIIKNHGGFIDVESKKGQGTSFHVYLPAVST